MLISLAWTSKEEEEELLPSMNPAANHKAEKPSHENPVDIFFVYRFLKNGSKQIKLSLVGDNKKFNH